MSPDRPDLSDYAAGGRPAKVPVDTGEERDPVDPVRPPAGRSSRRLPEEAVQLNVRLSRQYREQLDVLRTNHPTDRRATLRDVVEAAIEELSNKWGLPMT